MLGYVKPYKPDLKVREYEIYTGYYCGVCKYIGASYGQLPRMALSYDAAFLALMLASVSDEPDQLTQEGCVAHHIKKRTIIRNRAVEYAGDVMLILAWYKLQDDINDEGKAYAKAIQLVLGGTYKKLNNKHEGLCAGIKFGLEELAELEKKKSDSIDKVAEAFAQIMRAIFSEGLKWVYGADSEKYQNFHETFAKVGYHMGKWIYLMDAVDDIEENIESGSYNPLIYRFEYGRDGETPAEFRKRIADNLKYNLYQYLATLGEEFAKLSPGDAGTDKLSPGSEEARGIVKNKGIIENIIFFGMNKKTEEVLNQTDKKERI